MCQIQAFQRGRALSEFIHQGGQRDNSFPRGAPKRISRKHPRRRDVEKTPAPWRLYGDYAVLHIFASSYGARLLQWENKNDTLRSYVRTCVRTRVWGRSGSSFFLVTTEQYPTEATYHEILHCVLSAADRGTTKLSSY